MNVKKDMYAIRGRHLVKWFPVSEAAVHDCQIHEGKFYALTDASFDIPFGCTVVAGANGSGKSLLMSLIAGLEEPSSGSIECAGKVGLVFQDADSQIIGETPREDIAIGVRNQKRTKAAIAEAVEKALQETGLASKADFPSRLLSGGEKRRLAVADVLAMNAGIIIFDEPYANLDYDSVLQVNALLEKLIAEAKTVIILTHELEKCFALARHVLILHRGSIVFAGAPQECLALDLPRWGIHNPLRPGGSLEELIWR